MVMCAYLPPINLLQTFKGTLTIPLVIVSFLSVGGAKLKNMFKIGQEVRLKGNPLDEQLGEFIPLGIKVITYIKDVSNIKGTSGQWVKIAEHNDWIDSTWFERVG